VLFLSDDERLTLSHLAENRAIFAKGAVRAAQWLIGKAAGRYTMPEVLGL
jgi:4-hydroxy-tetrahydrodipicolinate reductase